MSDTITCFFIKAFNFQHLGKLVYIRLLAALWSYHFFFLSKEINIAPTF